MAEMNGAPEAVAEVAETVAEQAQEVAAAARGWTPREGRLFMTGALIGLFGGALVGYGFASKRLRTKYEKIAEDEINEMREHYKARLVAKEKKPDLGEQVENLGYSTPNAPVIEEDEDVVERPEVEVVEEVVVEEVEVVPEEPEETKVRVFDTSKDPNDDWDYEKEIAERKANPGKPYIIHYDERGEAGYSEVSFTYYSKDDVLADERDNVIEDKDAVVGEINLDKMGYGSNDNNVVYIRNDKLGIEVEVLNDDGSYAEVVHGFVQHSDEPPHLGKPLFDDESTPE